MRWQHFLGCKVNFEVEGKEKQGFLNSVCERTIELVDEESSYLAIINNEDVFIPESYKASNIKPILRPLSSMTKKEMLEASEAFDFGDSDTNDFEDFDRFMDMFWDYAGHVKGTLWLMEKGFYVNQCHKDECIIEKEG